MALNLQKGQKIDLTKGNAGLKKVIVGLGWDAVGGGVATRSLSIDCDAMAVLLQSGRFVDNADLVSFKNLNHISGCVNHKGDNLTGAGEGDDEQIVVDLASMPERYDRVVFAVVIYMALAKKQTFGMIKNAFIRIINADNNQELCRYNLSDDPSYADKTDMLFGELYRHNGEWKFNAIGEGVIEGSVEKVALRFA